MMYLKCHSSSYYLRLALLSLICWLSLPSALAQTSTAATQKAADVDAQVRPAKLRYEASKFFLSAQTEIVQEQISASSATAEMLKPSQHSGLPPKADEVIKQSIKMDAFGLQQTIHSWLNPDGTILQRTTITGGRKDRLRSYRYTEGGVYSVRRYPANSKEQDLAPEQWSKVREGYEAIAGKDSKGQLSEAVALLYLVPLAPLKNPGDRLVVPVHEDGQLVDVRVEVIGRQNLLVDYQLQDTKGSRKIAERIEVLHARIRASPSGSADSTSFDFLGYKGDVDLYIDPKRQVIVQMSGTYDVVGNVDIRLKQADFRP